MTDESRSSEKPKAGDVQADNVVPPPVPMEPRQGSPAPGLEAPGPPEASQQQMPEGTYRQRQGWLAAGVVVAVAGAVFALSRLPGRQEDKPPAKRALTNVIVQRIVPADFPDTIDLPGVVEPDRTVLVSARVEGQLQQINSVKGRKEGRPCTAGETIMTLDKELLAVRVAQGEALVRQLTAQVSRAEAQRDLAKLEVDSTAELVKKGGATEFTLEQARVRLEAAKAGIEQAREGMAEAAEALKAATINLGYATITAPIGGVLDKVMFEEGEYVEVGRPVARIVDTAMVRVAVDVPQRDIGCVRLGDVETVMTDLDAGPDGPKVTGHVDYISELADLGAKTTRVEVLVENPRRKLRSGQTVRVRLRREVIPQAIMVPLEAVSRLENGRAVYVVEAGKARRRKVTLGIWRGRNVQVLSGLQADDVLIVQGHHYVAEGQAVEVAKGAAATQPSPS